MACQHRQSSGAFHYRPVTPSVGRIRLIQILPRFAETAGTASADGTSLWIPSCNIVHASLDSPPPYVALSYAWGDATRSSPILVNGSKHMATENSVDLIRHLTPQEEPVVAWVDALCINQDDDEEKSEQVKQMAEVYARATHVLCWLGAEANQSDTAMRWMQQYGAEACRLRIGETPPLRLFNLLRRYNHDQDSIAEDDMKRFLHEIQRHFTTWAPGNGGPVNALGFTFSSDLTGIECGGPRGGPRKNGRIQVRKRVHM
ncbi:heterokaryon incompatibility protein-domain-containing protein [Xylariomycetidae sp. FL0641]|nr:heterokaryon incompatibility protein-domain-containing protein [Xylariomycetidae sp. FL0641]